MIGLETKGAAATAGIFTTLEAASTVPEVLAIIDQYFWTTNLSALGLAFFLILTMSGKMETSGKPYPLWFKFVCACKSIPIGILAAGLLHYWLITYMGLPEPHTLAFAGVLFFLCAFSWRVYETARSLLLHIRAGNWPWKT